ncbi:TBC1 domain family member 12 isoform X2 [Peromyscus californicus insignis]|uniref:TBC1 domain family member 12 isoform X2 n=1 Tax=Peromyscus californicus insignis TaxID=564181 RepID=UPI0022A7455B|nr:TBC1 domain family member 12 isoform X2 [Peromyscus californicus insignis]
MVRGRAGSRPARGLWCACAILARARAPATALAGGWEGWVRERCGGRGRGPCAQGSPPPPPPPQMMGPEDAGACSGRNAELLPVPGPMGQDGKTVLAAGSFGGGAVAAESPGEAGEEEAPRQLLQRYLAAAAAPLQPGLGGTEAEAVPAACRSSMTNGDSGFLLRQDRRGPEEARRRRSCGHPRLLDPADEGVDGAGGPDDWAAPLEDPLRSCCLAAGDTDDPEPTAATSAARPGGSAEPSPDLPDARFSSRNTFEVSRRQSVGDLLPSAGPPAPLPAAELGPGGTTARTRRSGGLADFFARNLFPKRTKELKSVVHSAPGWKLFGKVPPRENLQKTSKIIQQEYEARTGRTCKVPPQSSRRKNFEFEPLSTTALILEDRPSNLPAKSVEEALRHRQEYDEMVAEAKKRELYEIFLSRARERWKSFSETSSDNDIEGISVADREASLELIKLDISRTFPSLYIFQKGGPYHDVLHSVLGAYTCYRPDVGYVQGMSFIAAVLILNLEEADAFIAFANLLNKPCQLAFFRVDHGMMLKYFATFEVFFEENLSKLFLHFKSYSLTPDIYLIDWIFTLYSKSLPLDLACRVWDVFCRDGEEFLFRTGLGILRLYEDVLLQMDFIHIAQFLTKLPEDITSEKLFSCIAAIQMQNSTKKWTQVFASVTKDIKEGDKNSSPALKS